MGLIILQSAEKVLEGKRNQPSNFEEGAPQIFQQFYDLERDSLEVVFLGKSSVKLAVSPVQIYEDSSIVTYNLASCSQPIELSYYLLHEVFKNQSPKIVFLDISALFRDDTGEGISWHFVMDEMPLSINKMRAAFAYTNRENRNLLSILSPLYYYHARWDELTENDFRRQSDEGYYYTAGQYLTSLVSGTGLTYDNVNSEIRAMNAREGIKREYSDNTYCEYKIDGKLYEAVLNQNAIAYMKDMKNLCEKHDTELVLLKIPAIGMPQSYHGSWSYDKYLMIKEFCNETEIPFLDMVYDADYMAEINWKEDTVDGGIHLNIRGAEKVTDCIVAYLNEQNLERRIDERYYQFTQDYDRVKQICMLQSEYDLLKYIDRILENENYTVILSSQNDFQAGLSEDILDALSRLGLQSSFTDGVRDSFIGIIDRHEVIYEAVSNRKLIYDNFLPGGGKISIVSSGLNEGSYSSIAIDGKEYSANKCGLNFVIYDNNAKVVVDSVAFNTSSMSVDGFRNITAVLGYLSQYKQIINSHK